MRRWNDAGAHPKWRRQAWFSGPWLAGTLAVFGAELPSLSAGPKPLGPQFQVNTFGFDAQQNARVARSPRGHFVVVWNSFEGDGDPYAVLGQRFAPLGERLGGEFVVSAYTTNSQGAQDVAFVESSEFVATWTSNVTRAASVQRYHLDGIRLGEEVVLAPIPPYDGFDPRIASQPQGLSVVTWAVREAVVDGSSFATVGRALTPETEPSGPVWVANTYTTGLQLSPAVAVLSDQSFLVVWRSARVAGGLPLDISTVQGRWLDPAGQPMGAEITVDGGDLAYRFQPDVAAMPAGGAFVTWNERANEYASTSDIRGRRIGSGGAPVGSELRVSDAVQRAASQPHVASAPDGRMLVVWLNASKEGDADDDEGWIAGRRLSSLGIPVEAEFQVNSYTTGYQGNMDVDVDSSGRAVVVWSSDGSPGLDDSAESVQARLFEAITDGTIFVDGFEWGETGAWTGDGSAS